MSQVKAAQKVAPETRTRKRKNPLTLHRKCSEFKDFVKLLRESHARVSSKQVEPAVEVARN